MAYNRSKHDKRDESTNYASALSELKKSGPESLYLIWGDEDYLSRQFANSILNRCLPDGSSDFGYACFDGPEIDTKAFLDFIETPPFMSERSYCELRNVDFGKLEDFEKENIAEIFRNPPEYSSIVVLYYAHQTPDSRLKLIKNLRENGKELIFKETGLKVFVKPVLCAVGWFASSNDLFGHPVLVLMEKQLGSLIPKVYPKVPLSDKDRNLIIAKLSSL